MHSCSETKERITELLLDGADCRSDEVLSAELRGCGECRNEFNALRATLRLTMRLRETAAPAESYWIHYHTKLRRGVEDLARQSHAKAQRRKEGSLDFLAALRLCVKTSVPIPVPLVVVMIIACIALGVFAVRANRMPAAQRPVIVQVPVEVPVVQEKVVTRVVYRKSRPFAQSSKQTNDAARVEGTLAKSRPTNTPPTLEGFKPTEEVKLTVIKGGSTNEK